MTGVFFRVFAKVGVFFCTIFFILFFVVYGYRYDKNVGFIQKNVYVEFNFWSENSNIEFDGKSYYANNHKLELYNIDDGCYHIIYNQKDTIKCMEDNKGYSFAYVDKKGVKDVDYEYAQNECKDLQTFSKLDKFYDQQRFQSKIDNVFVFNKMIFVETVDSLYYCNNDITECKYITPMNGDVICGNKKGLVFVDTKYKLLELQ